MSSEDYPKTKQEATQMARKMCEEHWGPEKKPFRNVPWDWNLERDHSLIVVAQNEIEKYLRENKISYSMMESFPARYRFND